MLDHINLAQMAASAPEEARESMFSRLEAMAGKDAADALRKMVFIIRMQNDIAFYNAVQTAVAEVAYEDLKSD